MTFAHRSSRYLFYCIAWKRIKKSEKLSACMYVQKTQNSNFLTLLMFPKEAMDIERYGIKQEFVSEKRTLFSSFYRG